MLTLHTTLLKKRTDTNKKCKQIYLWITFGSSKGGSSLYLYNMTDRTETITKETTDILALNGIAYNPGVPLSPAPSSSESASLSPSASSSPSSSSSPSPSPSLLVSPSRFSPSSSASSSPSPSTSQKAIFSRSLSISASRSPVPDQPPIAPGSTITLTFGSHDPTFVYQDLRNPQPGTGQQFNISEQTNITYSDFEGVDSTLPFPSAWTLTRESFTGGSGVTAGNLSFTRLSSDSSGASPTYVYTYTSDQYKALGISIVTTTLFNPAADVKVRGPTQAGPDHTTPKKTVKFGIKISGAGSASLFGNDTQSVLRWSVCYDNDQALGHFDLDHPAKTTTGGVAVYTFNRLQQASSIATSSLQLAIPTQGVTDGELVIIAHDLSVKTTGSGNTVSFCVEWQFPYFESSLHYDPDLSVLAQPSSDNDSGDGDDNSMAIKIAVPVAVGGAFLIVCCVVIIAAIVAAIITRRRHNFVSRKLTDLRSDEASL
eukprot:TRINITY_DN4513_c0_g1_i3.p1 TRINITY_DN4513_c0_g1~~TRINITY_DN4513_c0_g1_i3.p1  ORF type:complete len:485 (-),score=71.57 TRINITY_DN4513_c0_g1_i3:41-1495(-)